MPFKVYQIQVADANLLPSKGTTQVYTRGTDKFDLTAPETNGAKPTSQSADEIPVIINEQNSAREIIVVWESTPGGRSVSIPRTQPTAVGTTTGDFLVTADLGNVDDARIDGDFQAKLPSGWKNGQQGQFTTSMCGLDAFIVSFRSVEGGKSKLSHVVIRVRKRIQCHLFEMKRSATAADTFEDCRAPIAGVQGFFSDKYGIDLVFPGDGKIVPEGTTTFHAIRTTSQVEALIPAAKTASRRPTHLWVSVVNAISSGYAGWGGSSLATVAIKDAQDSRKNWEAWVKSWNDYNRTQKGLVYEEKWVKDVFHPPLTGDERDVALKLARGRTTPDALASKLLRNLLLHEIGHTLGLVPSSAKAGGMDQGGWLDSGHNNHCVTSSCIMYYEGESAQLGMGLRIGEEQPFDHTGMENCVLYLHACDLTDLRRLPM